jgi:hypothetical protein
MAVVGQPKTTYQYIQVTGRVGAQVVGTSWFGRNLYSPHDPAIVPFEKFRSYHERLYAQVTHQRYPFSPPVLDRCLTRNYGRYVRQAGDKR